MTTERALRPRELAFIREYLVDRNATQAAIRAGYSPTSAGQHGNLMLHRPVIKTALARELKAQEKRTLITADGNLRAIERLAEKAEGQGEFAAAIRARELIGRHYRSFTDKVELTGKGDGPVEFTEIRRTVVDPKP